MAKVNVGSLSEAGVDLAEEPLIHVLHVDNDDDFLKIFKRILEMQGSFQVDSVLSVKEAMQKLEEKEFDVIVSDYQMPITDGLQFLNELRKKGNTIPFILFTGKGREDVAIEALNLGADYYINKTGKPETDFGELAHSIITAVEKQRSERMLKASEERFRLYVENSPSAIFVANPKAEYEYVNAAASKMLGYSVEELLSMSIPKVSYYPRDLSSFATLKKNGKITVEIILKHKNGEPVYVNLNAVKLPNGKLIAFCEDITERKKAEEELEKIFDLSPDMVCVCTTEGELLKISPSCEKILGYTQEELLKIGWSKLVHPDDVEHTNKEVERQLKGSSVANFVNRYRRKDGSYVTLEWQASFAEKGIVHATARDITEHKKAEEALRESEERFRTVFEGATDGILAADPENQRFVFANPKFCEISGYPLEELLTLGVADIHPKKDLQYVNEQFTKQAEGKITLAEDIPVLRKDKQVVYCDVNSSPMKIGKHQYLVGFFRDITERKKMEEFLKKSKKEFETYVNLAGVILIAIDAEGKVVYINKKGCEVLEYKKEEIVGKDWFSNFLPERIRKETKAVSKNLLFGQIRAGEHENLVLTKSGRERLIAWRNIPLRDAEGKIIEHLSSGEDITEQKKAEEVLRSSEERLRILFDFAPDAYYLNDLKGNFVDGNRAAEALMGYNKEELIGKSFLSLKLLSRKQILKATKLLTKNLLGKPTGPDEFVLNRKDGTQILVEIRTFPVKIKGQTRVLGIARDITERKKAEEEIQSLAKFPSENPNPVLRIAKDGSILYANKAAQTLRSELERKKNQLVTRILRQSVLGSLRSGLSEKVEVKYTDRMFSFVVAPVTEAGYVNIYGRDITERKKAEADLKDSEERFHAISISAQDAIIVIESDGNVTFWNPAAEKIFGYTEDEVIGKQFHKLLAPKRFQEDIQRGLAKFRETGEGAAIGKILELAAVKKDGTEIPIELSLSGLKIKGQIHAVGIVRDLTERKKAEEEIRSLAKFPGENPNPVLRVAKDGTVLFANAAAKRKLKKEKSGAGKLVLVRGRQLVSDVLKSGLSKEVEIEHEDKTFSFVFAPVTDAGYVNVYGRDITERKKAEEDVLFYSNQMEERVKERTRQIESIFASSPDPIIILDLNENIVDCNQSTLELIGFSSKEEMIGKSMFELIAEKDHEKAKKNLKKISQQKLVRNVECTLITRDGHEFSAEVSSSVLSDASGNPSGFVTVVNDITERKKLDTMKSQFISRAAHELKTPLISIKGYVDYIRTGTLGPVPEKIESSLKVVKRNTDRLISLTNDLLDIQYLQSGKLHLNLETLNFRKVIDNCVGEVQLFLNEKKQKLRLEVPEDRLLIRGDRVRLSQVLINLLNNAIKSTPEGGNITLRVGDDEGAIQVQVSDTGIGFTKEDLETVFQPFAEGITRYTKGTGLSLSLIKGLVELHGGKISVRSEGEGKGASFRFTLPKQGKKEAD